MSHPVALGAPVQATAPTISPGIVLGPPLLSPAPQTASTLEPAPSISQNGPRTGFFRWIANKWIALWSALWTCLTGRKRAAERAIPVNSPTDATRASAALARRIEEGGKLIDDHLQRRPGQDINHQIVIFAMLYNGQTVTCFRKNDEEGQPNIDVFVKTHLHQLLSSTANINIDNDLLQIESNFLERINNDGYVVYHFAISALSMYSYIPIGTPPVFSPSERFTQENLPELLRYTVPNETDRRTVIGWVVNAEGS